MPAIASGGIRNGIDAAKCLALGASLVGAAGSIFKSAYESQNALDQKIKQWIKEITITLFVTGSKSIRDLNIEKIMD